jgi:hypothetical protein
MARILINQEWYDEVAPAALYETEIENIVMQQAPLIFPDYYLIPFKKLVFDDFEGGKADFALIEKTYRDWWVVEVEMSDHHLYNHVIPQVRTLSNAIYGITIAEYFCSQSSELNLQSLRDMLKGSQPKVLVIINTSKPEWITPLERYNAKIMVFEMFRSSQGRHIFRLNGSYPHADLETVSDCYFDHQIPNFLIIKSPAKLGISSGEKVTIRYKNWVSEWQRLDSKEMVWLFPVEANPLPIGYVFELLFCTDGLVIREKHNRLA